MKQWLRTAFLAGVGVVLATAANAQIVINEVFYDSESSDTMTWVELKGPGGTSLDGYILVGVNGNGGGDYQPIDLSGNSIPADGYFVIAQDGAVVNADMVDTNVNYQNGPDSIQLRDAVGAIIDAVAYGVFAATDIPAGEGTPADDQNPPFSLARCPDGSDTDDNATDFLLLDPPTPGESNGTTCGGPGDPIPHTLCEIAANNADGTPALGGDLVIVSGVVISPTGVFSGFANDVKIWDGECCITVFDNSGLVPNLALGDEIEVVGIVGQFNGLTEIVQPNLTITVLSTGNPLPAPVPVSTNELATNGETYESCLIQLSCVSIVGGTWPADGSSATLQVDDGSGPVDLRIDSDTDIDGSAAPTGAFTIVGVAGQFDSASPYDTGYQMLPRFFSDLNYDDPACAAPTGACCIATPLGGGGFICEILTADECATTGDYQGDGSLCDPDPCPQPTGACCLTDGTCVEVTEADCTAAGGSFFGPGSVCDPSPCPTPSHRTTWGQIKGDAHRELGRKPAESR